MIKKVKNKKLVIFAPFIEEGGIEKNFFILTKYLLRKEIELLIITWNNKIKINQDKNLKILIPNKIFQKINIRFLKNVISLITLFFLIIKLKRNCLIFSFHSNLYVTIISKILKVKNIIRIAAYGWMFSAIKKKIFHLILKLPSEIIVNSLEMQSIIMKEFGVNTRCIYNPLNTKEINKLKNDNRKLFKDEKKNLKILFLGRLVSQKDPLTFLKSLKIIKNIINFEALIVGDGNLKKKIHSYIDKNKLNSKVKLIGYVDNPVKYLNQCDLLVLTSRFEGLPNVILEAQYLKKFVISTNCKTGPKEILKDGKIGYLVNQEDYKQLSKAIIYFFKNKKRSVIKEKIKSAYIGTRRFNYEKNCKKYLDLIEKYL